MESAPWYVCIRASGPVPGIIEERCVGIAVRFHLGDCLTDTNFRPLGQTRCN